jgi:hypothetical protein
LWLERLAGEAVSIVVYLSIALFVWLAVVMLLLFVLLIGSLPGFLFQQWRKPAAKRGTYTVVRFDAGVPVIPPRRPAERRASTDRRAPPAFQGQKARPGNEPLRENTTVAARPLRQPYTK